MSSAPQPHGASPLGPAGPGPPLGPPCAQTPAGNTQMRDWPHGHAAPHPGHTLGVPWRHPERGDQSRLPGGGSQEQSLEGWEGPACGDGGCRRTAGRKGQQGHREGVPDSHCHAHVSGQCAATMDPRRRDKVVPHEASLTGRKGAPRPQSSSLRPPSVPGQPVTAWVPTVTAHHSHSRPRTPALWLGAADRAWGLFPDNTLEGPGITWSDSEEEQERASGQGGAS